MSGKKQNEIKTKLDGMNMIPDGFRFNHEQTWQRLDAQLDRSKKKKFTWLYAAAVILLILGSFFVIRSVLGNKRFVVGTNYQSESSPARAIVRPKERKEEQVNIVAPRHVSIVKKTIHSIVKVEQFKQKVDSTITEQVTAILPTAIIQDTGKTLAVAKRKFRIAHINELNSSEPGFSVTEPKASIALLNRKYISELNEPVSVGEKVFIQPRQKAFLSFLTSSSQ